MLNYNEIERALTNGATESKVITKLFKDQTAYNTVMSNCQRIGGKRFCCNLNEKLNSSCVLSQ